MLVDVQLMNKRFKWVHGGQPMDCQMSHNKPLQDCSSLKSNLQHWCTGYSSLELIILAVVQTICSSCHVRPVVKRWRWEGHFNTDDWMRHWDKCAVNSLTLVVLRHLSPHFTYTQTVTGNNLAMMIEWSDASFTPTLHTLVHGLILPWLDYCNSLYIYCTASTLRQMLTVQDAAVRHHTCLPSLEPAALVGYLSLVTFSDVKRGKNLEAEARATKAQAAISEGWGQGRGQK